jgi:hypothetical protein
MNTRGKPVATHGAGAGWSRGLLGRSGGYSTTPADVLTAAGYRTIAPGKWHLGYAPRFHPLSRGFDDYYGFLQGARSYFPLGKPTQLNERRRDRTVPMPEKFDHMTDEPGRAAAAFIAENREQPFFMYMTHYAAHGPLEALASGLEKVNDESPRRKNPRAMARALDRSVGVVLDELKRLSRADITLPAWSALARLWPDRSLAEFPQAKQDRFIYWGPDTTAAGNWIGHPVRGMNEWIMSQENLPVAKPETRAGPLVPVRIDAGPQADAD